MAGIQVSPIEQLAFGIAYRGELSLFVRRRLPDEAGSRLAHDVANAFAPAGGELVEDAQQQAGTVLAEEHHQGRLVGASRRRHGRAENDEARRVAAVVLDARSEHVQPEPFRCDRWSQGRQ